MDFVGEVGGLGGVAVVGERHRGRFGRWCVSERERLVNALAWASCSEMAKPTCRKKLGVGAVGGKRLEAAAEGGWGPPIQGGVNYGTMWGVKTYGT